MSWFRSSQEKRWWGYTLLVTLAILSTLFLGQPLLKFFQSQDLRALFFLAGMILVAAAVLVYGWSLNRLQWVVLLGMVAVFLTFFLRLGMPERSHLIEFGVLTVFLHRALLERAQQGGNLKWVPWTTILTAFCIGVIDEWLQKFVPHRVFDNEDIIFNGLAILLTMATISLLTWARKKWAQ